MLIGFTLKMEVDVLLHYNSQTEYVFGYQLIVKQVLQLLDEFHLKSHLLPTKIVNNNLNQK